MVSIMGTFWPGRDRPTRVTTGRARPRSGGRAEYACLADVLHQASPPLVAAVSPGDRSAAGQAVGGAVRQRPLPRLPLQIPA